MDRVVLCASLTRCEPKAGVNRSRTMKDIISHQLLVREGTLEGQCQWKRRHAIAKLIRSECSTQALMTRPSY